MMKSLSYSMKAWPLNNKSSQMGEEVQAPAALKRCQDDAEPNSEEVRRTASWMKWLGTLFPGNSSIEEETLQPSAESLSRPPRRLSVAVEDVLQNVTSVATFAGSRTSSNAPPGILKGRRVHSSAIDTNLNVNVETSKDTVCMLRLLIMPDFFSNDDRVSLGSPATGSHHNTSLFKPDSYNVATVKTSHHVNLEESKGEEWGEGEGKEQPLADVAPEANEGHPPQPQTSLDQLLAYKPRRASYSPNNVEENVSTISESQYPPQTTFESFTMLSKPQGKTSPPASSEKNLSGRNFDSLFGSSFDAMTSTPSTGTFRDTKKRFVPTLANSSESQDIKSKNDDNWSRNLKEKPCTSNDNTPPINAIERMLKKEDIFPSTGSFRDSAKRHVRVKSESNQDWDTKPRRNAGHVRSKSELNQDLDIKPRYVDMRATLSRPSMPSPENVSAPPPMPSEDSQDNDFLNMLKQEALFPSTDTFGDSFKRHVRHVRVQSELSRPSMSPEKVAAPPMPSEDTVINFLQDNMPSLSTGTFRDTGKRHVRHVTAPIPNQEWGLKCENDNDGKTGRFAREAGTSPEAAELGELSVDWGHQGTSP